MQAVSHFQIDDGEIHASINQRDGMVVFLDNPEKYNSPTMMAHLDKEVNIFPFNQESRRHFVNKFAICSSALGEGG